MFKNLLKWRIYFKFMKNMLGFDTYNVLTIALKEKTAPSEDGLLNFGEFKVLFSLTKGLSGTQSWNVRIGNRYIIGGIGKDNSGWKGFRDAK